MSDPTSTRVDEISDGIYRISTPVPPSIIPGGFTFNQFLVADEAPLLFHTGLRQLFPAVRAAIDRVLPAETLRYVAFSHYEADECGSLNEFLAVAPHAVPVCSQVAAMVSIEDVADRSPRALADGESLPLGRRTVHWIDTPHLPHAWECGYLFESTTRTLFCGDLFTQGGDVHSPVTGSDILGPSDAMRKAFDYYSHTSRVGSLIGKLASKSPATLACMHGASWKGNGAELLRKLGEQLAASR